MLVQGQKATYHAHQLLHDIQKSAHDIVQAQVQVVGDHGGVQAGQDKLACEINKEGHSLWGSSGSIGVEGRGEFAVRQQGLGAWLSVLSSQSGAAQVFCCAQQSPAAKEAHRTPWEACRITPHLRASTTTGCLDTPQNKGKSAYCFSQSKQGCSEKKHVTQIDPPTAL